MLALNIQIVYVLLERDCTPSAEGAHADHQIWMYMGAELYYRRAVQGQGLGVWRATCCSVLLMILV